jgi:hypothetical protein
MVSLYYVPIVSRQLAHRKPESPAVRSIISMVSMEELDKLTCADIYLRCNFHMIKKYMTWNLDSLVSRYIIKYSQTYNTSELSFPSRSFLSKGPNCQGIIIFILCVLFVYVTSNAVLVSEKQSLRLLIFIISRPQSSKGQRLNLLINCFLPMRSSRSALKRARNASRSLASVRCARPAMQERVTPGMQMHSMSLASPPSSPSSLNES